MQKWEKYSHNIIFTFSMSLRSMIWKTYIDDGSFSQINGIIEIKLWRSFCCFLCETSLGDFCFMYQGSWQYWTLINNWFRIQSHYIYLSWLNKSNDLMISKGQGCIHRKISNRGQCDARNKQIYWLIRRAMLMSMLLRKIQKPNNSVFIFHGNDKSNGQSVFESRLYRIKIQIALL